MVDKSLRLDKYKSKIFINTCYFLTLEYHNSILLNLYLNKHRTEIICFLWFFDESIDYFKVKLVRFSVLKYKINHIKNKLIFELNLLKIIGNNERNQSSSAKISWKFKISNLRILINDHLGYFAK